MKSGSSKTEDEEKNGEESINEVNNIDDQNIESFWTVAPLSGAIECQNNESKNNY